MPSSKATADHAAELLSSLGVITQKRMFSGFGLYAEGTIVALIVFDRLYLKTDAHSKAHFVAAQCEPFTYEGKTKAVVVMSYYEPPAEAFDSSEAMRPWARLAIEAALRSANSKLAKQTKQSKLAKPMKATKATKATKKPVLKK
jgi:DNA transformation protein and related proteins